MRLDELEKDATEGEEDGPQEFSAPQPKATFPSSFGMSFCVSSEIKSIQAISRLGAASRYDREDILRAAAHHLGFSRITDAVRHPLKSAVKERHPAKGCWVTREIWCGGKTSSASNGTAST